MASLTARRAVTPRCALRPQVMMRLRTDTLSRSRLSGAGSDLTPLVDAWGRRKAEAPSRPLTYEMLTMGCQMNAADSERMAGSLEAIGFKKLEDLRDLPEDGSAQVAQGKADIVVINTCGRSRPRRIEASEWLLRCTTLDAGNTIG